MSALLDSLLSADRLADIAANEAAMLLRPWEPMESATEYAQRRAREQYERALAFDRQARDVWGAL